MGTGAQGLLRALSHVATQQRFSEALLMKIHAGKWIVSHTATATN